MSAAAPARATGSPARPGRGRRAGSPHLSPAPDAGRRRGVRPALVAGVIISAASLFLLVVCNVLIAQGQFERTKLVVRQEAEQHRYEDLRLDVAERSSPEAIVSAAVALGMVVPDQVEYIEAAVLVAPGSGDRTATTLDESWEDIKASLGPEP